MKARKDSLAGLTKEERLAKRKASMTAGDSWEDLHGTKSKPGYEVSEKRRLQLERKAAEEASRREQAAAAAAAAEEPAAGAAPASSQRRLSFVVDPEALEPGDAVQYV